MERCEVSPEVFLEVGHAEHKHVEPHLLEDNEGVFLGVGLRELLN